MRWDTCFIKLPLGSVFWDSVTPLPEHTAMRAVNHAIDEKRKKEKDDKKVKRWVKEQAKLNGGRQWQGSEEEEEEEEGDVS